ncbi:AraC family transcriptional regulator [Desulfocurvus sp. DL9XJH121]
MSLETTHKQTMPDQARVSWPSVPGVELLTARFTRQRFSRHFHRRYAVGVIMRGAMRFSFLGREFTAVPGSVNLTVPGEMHDGHAADLRQGWAYRMLYLDPWVVEDAASQAAGRAVAPPDFAAGVLHDPGLAARVHACHLLLDSPGAPLLARQTSLLEMLALWISRHADTRRPAPEPGPEPRGVALARECMDGRYGEDLSLDDLAALANLSPFHFVRVFRRAVGAPPHAYLLNARIRAARRLLATDARLADVAQETGFTDQAHLTNAFKRILGLTPGQYRKFLQNRPALAG